MTRTPLVGTAGVEDLDVSGADRFSQSLEVGHQVGRAPEGFLQLGQRSARPASKPVDPNSGKIPPSPADHLERAGDQGEGRAPGDDPTHVGRQLVAGREVHGAGHMRWTELGSGSKIDYPLAAPDPPADLEVVDLLGQGEVGRRRSLQIEGAHVGVVAGI